MKNKVYLNNGYLHINIHSDYKVTVKNLIGSTVFRSRDSTPGVINLKNQFPEALYLVQVNTLQGVLSYKMLLN